MGNSETKKSSGPSKLSESELQALQTVLNKSDVKGRLSQDVVFKELNFPSGSDVWLSSIWALLARNRKSVEIDDLKSTYESIVYGSLDDLCNIIAFILEHSKMTKEQFSLWLVQGAEVSSLAWKSWQEIMCTVSESSQNSLVQFLCNEHNGKHFDDLSMWLLRRPIVVTMLKALFRWGFQCTDGHDNVLFPFLVDVDLKGPCPTAMHSSEVLFVNSLLPHDLTCEWRLLFSTSRHGLSFSTLVARIINQGPNVIIVKDTDNHVFGGFASVGWSVGPNFIGDERCFLFSLRPKMSMYVSTGYNNHFMYLNQQQQTLPNGLGMGGQHEYFGLWLDAEFGKGHSSKTCTTYGDYTQLSSKQVFNIDHVEVWAVGRPPRPDSDSDEPDSRSILDRDPGAKAILEMIDRGQHSEGLREPEPS